MSRFLYSTLLYLLTPLQFLKLWLRGRKLPAYRQRWRERLALGPKPDAVPRIWLHAVSVGETIAAGPLVKALLERFPDHRLLVTSTTPTGSDQVRRQFGEAVEHCYFPYDLPGTIKRFLRRYQPDALIVMETELWPNCFFHCHRRGIPIIVANARLSPRSFASYRRFLPLVTPTLRNVDAIAAQSEDDRARFIALGAPLRQVFNSGNIKFDLNLDEDALKAGKTLRQQFGDRPVWIAASTHDGEEAIMLEAHQQLRERLPDALLILVPRHPQRFDEVAQLCAGHGMTISRRSEGIYPDEDTAVYLGDTMGELMTMFAAADIAFVGGSLNDTGGHNPLEPASLGLPVLTGPTIHNFLDIYASLIDAGNAEVIDNAAALSAGIERLLKNDNERRRRGEKGRSLIAASRGATDAILSLVEKALSSQDTKI